MKRLLETYIHFWVPFKIIHNFCTSSVTNDHFVRRAFRYELKLFGVQSVLRIGWLQEKYNVFNKLLVLGISKNSCVTAVVECTSRSEVAKYFSV